MPGEYDAAIAAGAQSIDNSFNMVSAAKTNRKDKQYMTDAATTAYERSREMWNDNNNWNLHVSDPAFNMQRLKNAGLNPWLAAGKPEITTASAPNVAKADGYKSEKPTMNSGAVMQNYLSTKMMQKQLQIADADVQQKIAQANLTNTQAKSIDTLLPGQTQALSLANINSSLQSEQLKSQTGKINQEINNLIKSGSLTDAQKENVQTMTAKGLKEIDNLVSQGQLTQAKIKETQIANDILSATSGGKISAENARNKLVTDSGGMSDKTMTYIPGAIIGNVLKDGRGLPIPKRNQKNMLNFKPNEVPKSPPKPNL